MEGGAAIWEWMNQSLSSDSVWHITNLELLLRLCMATILGGLIGIERERNNHPAGFRTHILVCLGSTTIMLLSIYGFSAFAYEYNVRMDPARLAAQVISGIGFLGAGAILRNGNMVTGLTTAASIWVVAAIGLCVGAGFYLVAFISTVLVLTSLYVLNKFDRWLLKGRHIHDVKLIITSDPATPGAIIQQLAALDIDIENMQMSPAESHEWDETGHLLELNLKLKTRKSDRKLLQDFEHISASESIIVFDAKQLHIQKQKIERKKNNVLT